MFSNSDSITDCDIPCEIVNLIKGELPFKVIISLYTLGAAGPPSSY